jgi:hypothetical protein
MIEKALIIILGVAIVALSFLQESVVLEAQKQAAAWRLLYLKADADSQYVNCVSLDNNFVVCEKPAHVKYRR